MGVETAAIRSEPAFSGPVLGEATRAVPRGAHLVAVQAGLPQGSIAGLVEVGVALLTQRALLGEVGVQAAISAVGGMRLMALLVLRNRFRNFTGGNLLLLCLPLIVVVGEGLLEVDVNGKIGVGWGYLIGELAGLDAGGLDGQAPHLSTILQYPAVIRVSANGIRISRNVRG